MKGALTVVGDSFAQVLRHVWTLLAVNVFTVLLSLPFAGGLALLVLALHLPAGSGLIFVAIALAVLPTPTAAGLHVMMRDLARGEPVHLSDWRDGLKTFGVVAARAWAIGLAALAIIATNLAYYPHTHFVLAPAIEIMWVYVLTLWLCIQVYMFPLIVGQESASATLAYRDAFLLASRHRTFTVLIAGAWLAVAALSTFSMLMTFLGFAITAGIQHNAAARIIDLQATTRSASAEARGMRLR